MCDIGGAHPPFCKDRADIFKAKLGLFESAFRYRIILSDAQLSGSSDQPHPRRNLGPM